MATHETVKIPFAKAHGAKNDFLLTSTGPRDVTILQVGNPQCAVPVEDFDFDWGAMGAEIERQPGISRTAPTFRLARPWMSTPSTCDFTSMGPGRR